MSFYQVPKFVFSPIAKSSWGNGTILLPTDFDGQLEKQVQGDEITEIIRNEDEQNLHDPEWWESFRGRVDWVVAITQGAAQYTSWITEYGMDIANEGLIILDRLTFLEPTRNREGFLNESSLVNMKILSPRPCFRADGKQLKDSVTSAWFVFKKAGAARCSTFIDFEVGWQHPKNLRK